MSTLTVAAWKRSLINLSYHTQASIQLLFEESLKLKRNFLQFGLSAGQYHSGYKGTAALLFFEPSTRTRFSFEAAASRAGFHPLILDGGIGTSLEKGETIEDTILNIEALRPLFFVVRCHDLVDLQSLSESLSVPVINAGWGRKGHPTQALLDALTIYEKLGDLRDRRVLFVGDVKHSRVVSSHLELSQLMGYQVGISCPQEFRPNDQSAQGEKNRNCPYFSNLNEGLEWADVVIALRVQKERHDNENLFLIEDYREHFGLNAERVQKHLKSAGLIMHPGPINYGVEIESDLLKDQRCLILKQVENGAFLREGIIRLMFDQSQSTHQVEPTIRRNLNE